MVSYSLPLILVFYWFAHLQPSSLSSWAATLLSAHSRQLEVNKVVARWDSTTNNSSWNKFVLFSSCRTFCHLLSREEAQYLTALWNVQPALDTEAQVFSTFFKTECDKYSKIFRYAYNFCMNTAHMSLLLSKTYISQVAEVAIETTLKSCAPP